MGIHIPLPESPYENTVSYIIVSVLTTALLPALLEEFAFRGVILGSLRRFGDGFAVDYFRDAVWDYSFLYYTNPHGLYSGLGDGIYCRKNQFPPAGNFDSFFNNFCRRN